jgi:hypothetical protein
MFANNPVLDYSFILTSPMVGTTTATKVKVLFYSSTMVFKMFHEK